MFSERKKVTLLFISVLLDDDFLAFALEFKIQSLDMDDYRTVLKKLRASNLWNLKRTIFSLFLGVVD